MTITNSGTISADGGTISYDTNADGTDDFTSISKGSTSEYEAAIAFYRDGSPNAIADGLTVNNSTGGVITAGFDTIKLFDGAGNVAKNVTITNAGDIKAISTTSASGYAINAHYVENFTLDNTGDITSVGGITIEAQTAKTTALPTVV